MLRTDLFFLRFFSRYTRIMKTLVLSSHKRYFLLLFALLLAGGGAFYLFFGQREGIDLLPPRKKEVTATVFMHGSFATMLGFLSLFNVIEDNVENTYYKKVTSGMRYDPYFYQMQPLLAPGLHPVIPTFTVPVADEPLTEEQERRLYAVYPFSAAYKTIADTVALSNNINLDHELSSTGLRKDKYCDRREQNSEPHFFYTFGWSGLVSQHRRRKEAVRFYNMLSDEIAALEQKNISPKISIVSHSHGGNVALNLAGIHELLACGLEHEPVRESFETDDEYAAVLALYKHIISLPPRSAVRDTRHQKKWDYRPTLGTVAVDELILLGTPIQPETAHFAASQFFGRVINLYSPNDKIQRMDWVSTRRSYSQQRFDWLLSKESQPVDDRHVVQLELTVNKTPEELAQIHKESLQRDTEGDKQRWWHTLLSNPGLTSTPLNPDPQHKELWFMSWHKLEQTHAQDHIAPYPYAIFIPVIKEMLARLDVQGQKKSSDLSLTCTFSENQVQFDLRDYQTLEQLSSYALDRELLANMQGHAEAWRPMKLNPNTQMELLHRYSQLAQLSG